MTFKNLIYLYTRILIQETSVKNTKAISFTIFSTVYLIFQNTEAHPRVAFIHFINLRQSTLHIWVLKPLFSLQFQVFIP